MKDSNLSLQITERQQPARVLALGEVLWDIFPDSTRLGGAPLNFAAHAQRMGHRALLISAVGEDDLGMQALAAIECLGLETTLLQRTAQLPTGRACVHLEAAGQTTFSIHRPAAYDAVKLSERQIQHIQIWSPQWLYFGTLFPAISEGRATLGQLLSAAPEATRFYDLNLRPGFDCPALVSELLGVAQVVKLNEQEMNTVAQLCGFPSEIEAFCRAACESFHWTAVCVTLGASGCAILAGTEFVEAPGCRVDVADPVGTGDAFAAAFLHGLTRGWKLAEIARFSNRVGALVASRPGAIPDWSLAEAAQL